MCCRLCFLGVSMRLCGFDGGWEKWVIANAYHHIVAKIPFIIDLRIPRTVCIIHNRILSKGPMTENGMKKRKRCCKIDNMGKMGKMESCQVFILQLVTLLVTAYLFTTTVLLPHQVDILNCLQNGLRKRKNTLIVAEAGSGKTLPVWLALLDMIHQWENDPSRQPPPRFLVLAPNHDIIRDAWLNGVIPQFCTQETRDNLCLYEYGTEPQKNRLNTLRKTLDAADEARKPCIIFTTYHLLGKEKQGQSLLKTLGGEFPKNQAECRLNGIVCDEVHHLKNHQCLPAKCLWKYASTIPRITLSATMFNNQPETEFERFRQEHWPRYTLKQIQKCVYVLPPDTSCRPSFTRTIQYVSLEQVELENAEQLGKRYIHAVQTATRSAGPQNAHSHSIVQGALNVLRNSAQGISMQGLCQYYKNECGWIRRTLLPDTVVCKGYCGPLNIRGQSTSQLNLLTETGQPTSVAFRKDDFVTVLSDEVSSASSEFVKVRLGKSPDYVYRHEHSTKDVAVLKHIEQAIRTGQKLVVVSDSATKLKYLRHCCETRFPTVMDRLYDYIGATSAPQRRRAMENSQGDGFRLIFLSAAGCEGIHLGHMQKVIFINLTFNPSFEQQTLGRVLRMKKKDGHTNGDPLVEVQPIEIIYMANQIDSVIMKYLEDKRDEHRNVMYRLRGQKTRVKKVKKVLRVSSGIGRAIVEAIRQALAGTSEHRGTSSSFRIQLSTRQQPPLTKQADIARMQFLLEMEKEKRKQKRRKTCVSESNTD